MFWIEGSTTCWQQSSDIPLHVCIRCCMATYRHVWCHCHRHHWIYVLHRNIPADESILLLDMWHCMSHNPSWNKTCLRWMWYCVAFFLWNARSMNALVRLDNCIMHVAFFTKWSNLACWSATTSAYIKVHISIDIHTFQDTNACIKSSAPLSSLSCVWISGILKRVPGECKCEYLLQPF